MKKILCICFLICTLLSGCAEPSFYVPQTVTRVDIYGVHNKHNLRRHYTEPNKMQSVLNYLRLLDFNGQTDLDPEFLPGDDFKIYLGFSDGQRKVYRIHADRYLCNPSGKWEKVDTEAAKRLMPYLQITASDL